MHRQRDELAVGVAARNHAQGAVRRFILPVEMRIMMRIVSLRPLLMLLALAGLPGCAPAKGPSPLEQPAAYARTPGETLRYRERYEWSSGIGMGLPPEAEQSGSVRETHVAIQFTGGDTARAWIESLRIATPGQPDRVAGADVLHLPFLLTIGPLGIDSVFQRPPIPSGWEVDHFFTRYLPRLPGGPLTPGRTWQNASHVDLSDSTWFGGLNRTTNYRVVGDSVTRGERVVVVEYTVLNESQRRMRNSPTEAPGMPYLRPMVISTFHEEQGRLYLAPRTGRLVLRTRSGVYEQSSTSYTNVEASTVVTNYRGSSELISAGRR
jgi:hypothetical protein